MYGNNNWNVAYLEILQGQCHLSKFCIRLINIQIYQVCIEIVLDNLMYGNCKSRETCPSWK